MIVNINNFGVINFYENNDSKKEATKNTKPVCEDVTPVQEEKPAAKKPLPFFVPEKLAALGTYTEEEFESMYHDAVQSGAPKLAKFIKHYRELEVFDTKDLNKKDTYEELKAYFGDELDFGYPNFAAYY